MPRDSGRNATRGRIAHLAARLMAEDGIEDYALAKRKAARQAGMPDTRDLPANEEIEAALKLYRQIHQPDTHRAQLRALRRTALQTMREMSRFNPYLTGTVLNGIAGKYADINLQLFTENVKAVELFLIDRGIPYRAAQTRLYAGQELRTVPVFTIIHDGIEIEIAVLSSGDLRLPLRSSMEGKIIERAKIQLVEELLAQT
jgi:hypothetical protein